MPLSFISSGPTSHQRTLIMRLPNELLSEIASFIPLRHDSLEYIIEARGLAAFSATSHRMRAIALPLLFRSVPIASECQLIALSSIPPQSFKFIHELNIFMDVEFFDSWKTWAFMTPRQTRQGESSPYTSLITILSRATSLETLRMRVAELSGTRSAWHRYALSRVHGIPLGNAFERALGNRKFVLPSLSTIELDGFQDVEPMLRLTPNLHSLRLVLSAGFTQDANVDLVEALQHVPKLRKLLYTPETLRLNSVLSGLEDMFEIMEEEPVALSAQESNVELIESIGHCLPNLEILDLQARWYGDAISFSSSAEAISSDSLISATEKLPNLRRISLPSSVMSPKNFTILRAHLPTVEDEIHTEAITARSLALSESYVAEKNFLLQLGKTMTGLREVEFIRPVAADCDSYASVRYSIKVVPERTIILGPEFGGTVITRPCNVSILSSNVYSAHHGEYDAWPYARSISLRYTLRKLWTASPSGRHHLAMSYARDHQAVAVLLASVGGCLAGEAGRGVYNYTESAFVATMFVGSALYACSQLISP